MTAAKDKPKIGIVGGGRLAQAMACHAWTSSGRTECMES